MLPACLAMLIPVRFFRTNGVSDYPRWSTPLVWESSCAFRSSSSSRLYMRPCEIVSALKKIRRPASCHSSEEYSSQVFMTNILDKVAHANARQSFSRFEPTSTSDVLALLLARRLDDGVAARYYAKLCQHYAADQIVTAWSRARRTAGGAPLYRIFDQILKALRTSDAADTRPKLCAIRIERRAIAVAVMSRDQPEYLRARQLSSDPARALRSAAYFISKVLNSFPVRSAALESVPKGQDHHRSQLTALISSILREAGVSITEVHKRKIFESFGNPPVRSRKAVRQVVERLYPFEPISGSGAPFVRDALALGLHVQTERLFDH